MINVRCKVSVDAAAKVAFIAGYTGMTRSDVYAMLIEGVTSGMTPEELARSFPESPDKVITFQISRTVVRDPMEP